MKCANGLKCLNGGQCKDVVSIEDESQTVTVCDCTMAIEIFDSETIVHRTHSSNTKNGNDGDEEKDNFGLERNRSPEQHGEWIQRFVGSTCQVAVLPEDYCAGSNSDKELFCVNGGSCRKAQNLSQDEMDQHPCACQNDFHGRHCEYAPNETHTNDPTDTPFQPPESESEPSSSSSSSAITKSSHHHHHFSLTGLTTLSIVICVLTLLGFWLVWRWRRRRFNRYHSSAAKGAAVLAANRDATSSFSSEESQSTSSSPYPYWDQKIGQRSSSYSAKHGNDDDDDEDGSACGVEIEEEELEEVAVSSSAVFSSSSKFTMNDSGSKHLGGCNRIHKVQSVRKHGNPKWDDARLGFF